MLHVQQHNVQTGASPDKAERELAKLMAKNKVTGERADDKKENRKWR